MVMAFSASVVLATIFSTFIYFIQSHLIYHPRRYDKDHEALLNQLATQVCYTTNAGRQTALYVKPRLRPEGPPDRIWILFHGNSTLALQWFDILNQQPDPRAGYLMIDYPGYGRCEGKPTPETILESSEKAMATLADQLHTTPQTLFRRLNIMGYSLGTAAALQLAVRTEPQKIVLVAPFTTMMEMARRTVHWPLCLLLRHRFDNVARLAELAQRPNRPRVIVIHGDHDGLVPVEMSRRIARRWPDWIEYHEVPGSGHMVVADAGEGEAQVVEALRPRATETAAVSAAR